jgi:para-nitrobenzyl esterase
MRLAPLFASGVLLTTVPIGAHGAVPDAAVPNASAPDAAAPNAAVLDAAMPNTAVPNAAVRTTSKPRVTLGAGVLEGTFPRGAPGAVFKGIPFAEPPVGPLRWHEPVAIKSWHGVRDASAFGPACSQNGRDGPTGVEDCLYLNVWTHERTPRGSHPVMLWLFGGANAVGSASNPVFDGSSLARRGMVVVTANYRVGVLGFMAHPALSAQSSHNSSGNYALLDQIMALRWIRENIAKFGGDPRHVTLFGQSSGSYDLLLLMTSPLAKGLFVNAIAESGQMLSYGGSMPKARAEEIGTHIAADLKAPQGPEVLSYLRGLPAAQVVAAAAKWLPTDLGSDTGLLTNVDGWVLPELPARVFADGREMAIPLIIGNNAREITPQVSVDELRQQITAKYADLAPRALEAYGLANGGQGHDDPLLGGAGSQWMTDIVQRCAAITEAEWHAGVKNPTWQYQFERSVPGKEAAGATHGAEVAFVFGTLDIAGPDTPTFTEADHKASEQIQEYWTRFAKTGDPNGGSLPAWPRAGSGSYVAFTANGPLVKETLQARPCHVFYEWTLRHSLPHH